jgi:hypothetical protein
VGQQTIQGRSNLTNVVFFFFFNRNILDLRPQIYLSQKSNLLKLAHVQMVLAERLQYSLTAWGFGLGIRM